MSKTAKAGKGCLITIGAAVVLIIVIVVVALAASGGGSSTTGNSHDKGSAAPAASSHKQKPQTIEYVVTGTSGSDVTYGPSGSDFKGAVPMDITAPLRSADFYSIDAQLQGETGSVACEIKVNGAVVSRANANGDFNIASCEISQDPITGKWTDDNSQ